MQIMTRKVPSALMPVLLAAFVVVLGLGCDAPAQSADSSPLWAERNPDLRQILYVLHSADDEMTVIDVETNQVIDVLWVGARPHGITTPNSWGWGPEPQAPLYIATEHDDALTVLDPVTNEIIARYEGVFGSRPNEIAITSDGRFLYVPAYGGGVYEVFDTERKEIITRIPVPGLAHNTVVSPDDRYMFLAALDQSRRTPGSVKASGYPTSYSNAIYVVDTRTHEIIDEIYTGNSPRPIAISPDGKQLYANVNNLMGFLVIDLESRPRRISSVAVYNYHKGVSEELIQAFTDGTGDVDLRPRIENCPVEGCRTHGIAVTPDGKEVWSTDLYRNLVFAFDVTGHTPRQIARLDTGEEPHWVAASLDGKTMYTANTRDNTVSAFDIETKTEIARIQLQEGSRPKRMLVVGVANPTYLPAVAGGSR